MLFNLGTLGVLDTTRPQEFAENLPTTLIQSFTPPQQGETEGVSVPADCIDRAILVSLLQKALTDFRDYTTADAIAYIDRTYPEKDLRTARAIHHGMEVGITHKVKRDYPNAPDHDHRPDDLPDDIAWQSLASLQSAYKYYRGIADGLKKEVDARIKTIVALHPRLHCDTSVEESIYVVTPKPNSKLPQL